MLTTRTKAYLALIITALSVTILMIKPLRADFVTLCTTCESNYYLNEIADYTYASLRAVNNIPAYMEPMANLANSWLKTDDSSATSTLQTDFTKYSNAILSNSQQQLNGQTAFLDAFFTQNNTTQSKPTPQSIPFANEVTYSTVLGKPYFQDPELDAQGNPVDSVMKYVENASGQAISHTPPGSNWAGDPDAQNRYKNYYKTISAIQTFNTYVASELYINKQNGFNLSNLQVKLMQDATDADSWFKQIASEDLGLVLRQILLFNSQMYVLMVNVLQAQKDQLFAQVMQNSLMIMGNQFTEDTMAGKAQGKIMGP